MARARCSHNAPRPPRRLAWGTFTCSRQEDLAPLAPPPETRARDLGEHSARGRYVGQHVPTETTRHPAKDRASPDGDVNVFERPMRTEKQNTQRPGPPHAPRARVTPAQSVPFTRRHGLPRCLAEQVDAPPSKGGAPSRASGFEPQSIDGGGSTPRARVPVQVRFLRRREGRGPSRMVAGKSAQGL